MEVILAALQDSAWALNHAAMKLKSDRGFILQAVPPGPAESWVCVRVFTASEERGEKSHRHVCEGIPTIRCSEHQE